MVTPNWIIYVIHLKEPMAGRNSHYIGKSKPKDLAARIDKHRAATHPTPGPLRNGAAVFLAEANDRHIEWWVTALYTDHSEGGALERKMKNRKGARAFCETCIRGQRTEADVRGYVASLHSDGEDHHGEPEY
jgi:predicted GIY-YIG superfamily endonuclease